MVSWNDLLYPNWTLEPVQTCIHEEQSKGVCLLTDHYHHKTEHTITIPNDCNFESKPAGKSLSCRVKHMAASPDSEKGQVHRVLNL